MIKCDLGFDNDRPRNVIERIDSDLEIHGFFVEFFGLALLAFVELVIIKFLASVV